MRVAIMQPTYLPWIGYFGLMYSVDTFVLLDSVQFAKRSWQQRNQIKTTNGAQWLSVPVLSKGKRDQKICQVELDPTSHFLKSHRQAIEHNYCKAPHYSLFSPHIMDAFDGSYEMLSKLNIDFIFRIRDCLNINTKIVRSSEMNGNGDKADLLLSLCRELGASEYISPPGSRGYLEETDVFLQEGIPVKYFNFSHPIYPQIHGEFLSHLSCIDLLFNCGKKSRDLIIEGCEVVL